MSKAKTVSKFIIYKATGGITHMLYGLTYAMYVAKKHGRTLIIDTVVGQGSLRDKFSEYFVINDKSISYTDDFSVLDGEKITYRGLSKDELAVLSAKYCGDFYSLEDKNIKVSDWLKNKDSKIEVFAGSCPVLSDMNILSNMMHKRVWKLLSSIVYFRKIKVTKELYREVKKRVLSIEGDYIGVHYRNTDAKSDIERAISKIRFFSQRSGIKQLYLATDDYYAKEKFEEALKNMKIIALTTPIQTEAGSNTHYNNTDARKQSLSYFTDVYMLLGATCFIGSDCSGMSSLIDRMRKLNFNYFDMYEKSCFQWRRLYNERNNMF